MAVLPKVDSIGLRLAKVTSAGRVSSVTTITKADVNRSVGTEPSAPPRADEAGNGRTVISASNRRASGS
jgi:hypothetical protein